MFRRFFIICITAAALLSIGSCTDNTIGRIYSITYYSFDATGGIAPEKQTKEHGVDIIISDNTGSLVKNEEVLYRWNTSISGMGSDYDFGAEYSGNADLSLYPVWGHGFIITYDRNTATSGTIPNNQTKPEGTEITISENSGSLELTAYGFCGWNTEADGSGTKYSPGSSYSDDSNITLYAMWYDVDWAKTTVAPTGSATYFNAITASASYTYAAGYQASTSLVDYGGASASGFNGGDNAVLVKYDSSGNALWAATPIDEENANISWFNAAAVDSNGNIYAAGYITGEQYFQFGANAETTVSSINSTGTASVLVKYDPDGNAVWARTTSGGVQNSEFHGIACNGGYIYVVGKQTSQNNFDYNDGVTAQGTSAGSNAVIVKYDEAGSTILAATTISGSDNTVFYDVAIDSAGDVYAAGTKNGTGSSDFGAAIPAFGFSTLENAVLVKYDKDLVPIWCETADNAVMASLDRSQFYSVTVDSSNNIYAAGYQYGSNQMIWDSSTPAMATGSSGQENALLVKFDSGGSVAWAEVPEAGTSISVFKGVSTYGENIYTAGYFYSTNNYNFGDAAAVTGYTSNQNPVLVRYASDGKGIWAKTSSEASADASFEDVFANYGSVMVAGFQFANPPVKYGINTSNDPASAAGAYSSGYNAVILRYVR